jgi:hypothetical protein
VHTESLRESGAQPQAVYPSDTQAADAYLMRQSDKYVPMLVVAAVILAGTSWAHRHAR